MCNYFHSSELPINHLYILSTKLTLSENICPNAFFVFTVKEMWWKYSMCLLQMYFLSEYNIFHILLAKCFWKNIFWRSLQFKVLVQKCKPPSFTKTYKSNCLLYVLRGKQSKEYVVFKKRKLPCFNLETNSNKENISSLFFCLVILFFVCWLGLAHKI